MLAFLIIMLFLSLIIASILQVLESNSIVGVIFAARKITHSTRVLID
jgi:hypothetical protein